MIRLLMTIAAIATFAVIDMSIAVAQPVSEPLMIAKQGFFYIGGRRFDTSAGPVIADRMYVEFQIPEKKTQPYGIVLYHGGGPSGAEWGMTPDGREGWREYFLRRGFTVYVVDAPTVGRSGYNSLVDGPQTIVSFSPEGEENRLTRSEDHPLWPQARKHSQFPGTGLPGDPSFEALVAHGLPGVEGVKDNILPPLAVLQRTDEITQAASAALLDRIGPSIILTHSRAGTFGWLIADARPKLVKAVVAVEPNGPPFYNTLVGGNPTTVARPWGLTYAKLSFRPAPKSAAELAPTKQLAPDSKDLVGCWPMGGRKRTLPNLKGIPILIVTSEASYHAQYDQCTSQFLTGAGVANEHLRLESIGIHGNGHVMMLEKNSDEIAGVIANWLEKKVR